MVDGFGLPLQYERQHDSQSAHHLFPGVYQVPQLSVGSQTLDRKERDTNSTMMCIKYLTEFTGHFAPREFENYYRV